jgi:large subunit ribosomal protein L23
VIFIVRLVEAGAGNESVAYPKLQIRVNNSRRHGYHVIYHLTKFFNPEPCTMQSILLRRCYATIPNVAAIARRASTPLAVRSRRAARDKRQARLGRHDATASGGRIPTEEEWVAELNERRSRIRGVKTYRMADGQKGEMFVGQRIYLPNVIIKMVRNHTPAGQPYNPYEATIRVPPSLTKNDIRSYLHSVYGVKTTYIRTDNYISPLFSKSDQRQVKKERRGYRTYKRAVVGLVEPFYYPMALEDVGEEERLQRVKAVEATYGIEQQRREYMRFVLRQTKSATADNGASTSTWKWRGEATANRGKILKLVAMRRAAREADLESAKHTMLSARAQGKSVIEP